MGVNVKTQKNESVAAILILMVIHKVLYLYCLVLDFPLFVFLFWGDSCNSELNGNVWYWHVYIYIFKPQVSAFWILLSAGPKHGL